MAKKAFVVDDNRTTAEALAKILTLLDVDPVVCLGPRDAIQRLAAAVPDFMTLDVNMPGVDGLEVIRYIRRDPRTARLPIIVISSESQPEQIKKAMKAGADGFLPKPVDVDQLERAMNDVLRKR